jgi:hypothetical protein
LHEGFPWGEPREEEGGGRGRRRRRRRRSKRRRSHLGCCLAPHAWPTAMPPLELQHPSWNDLHGHTMIGNAKSWQCSDRGENTLELKLANETPWTS